MVTTSLRLVRPVGKGGMGEVWVAYHQSLGTEVAIKFVDVAIARSNPKVVERFNREAGIAAQLKNPHIAQTYDHGVLEDGTPYIVMELLEGESLQERIVRTGALSLYETSLVVSQTAQALGKAHKRGVVHRDVKPGNLFCIDTDYDLFIKLLDFGIAKHTGGIDKELTNTRNMLGSPLYMSPEQFTSAKGVDWRGDLWALAVVAYRCLTGVPPFNGEAIGHVIMAVMNGDYVPVTERRPLLPRVLDDWFAQAFNKDIGQRFQSAKDLGLSFAQLARNAAVAEPRPPLPSITEGLYEESAAKLRESQDRAASSSSPGGAAGVSAAGTRNSGAVRTRNSGATAPRDSGAVTTPSPGVGVRASATPAAASAVVAAPGAPRADSVGAHSRASALAPVPAVPVVPRAAAPQGIAERTAELPRDWQPAVVSPTSGESAAEGRPPVPGRHRRIGTERLPVPAEVASKAERDANLRGRPSTSAAATHASAANDGAVARAPSEPNATAPTPLRAADDGAAARTTSAAKARAGRNAATGAASAIPSIEAKTATGAQVPVAPASASEAAQAATLAPAATTLDEPRERKKNLLALLIGAAAFLLAASLGIYAAVGTGGAAPDDAGPATDGSPSEAAPTSAPKQVEMPSPEHPTSPPSSAETAAAASPAMSASAAATESPIAATPPATSEPATAAPNRGEPTASKPTAEKPIAAKAPAPKPRPVVPPRVGTAAAVHKKPENDDPGF